MLPSYKTLCRLTNNDGPKARVLRNLLEGKIEPRELSPACDRWVRQCHNDPSHVEQVMCAADEWLGTYGVEAIFGDSVTEPRFSYCNTGDTYALTLIYDHSKGRYLVSSYGDEIERAERNGERFE